MGWGTEKLVEAWFPSWVSERHCNSPSLSFLICQVGAMEPSPGAGGDPVTNGAWHEGSATYNCQQAASVSLLGNDSWLV